jgi:hypothetical protein
VERDIIAEAVGPLPFPSFWRIDDLARLLAIETAEVRRLVRDREIAAFWVGGEYRVLTKDIIVWLVVQRSMGGERSGGKRRR